MIYSDYHIHTSFSGDCVFIPEQVVDSAIKKGLKEICITDHQDFGFIADDILYEIDAHNYFKKIQEISFKSKNQIIIKTGIEMGLEPDKKDKIDSFLSSEDFDFVIGASHLINGFDPYYPDYFKGKSDEEAFLEYFESILRNLDVCNNFDVYGHLDYVVRYAPNQHKFYSYNKFKDIIDNILSKIISMNKGIEINSGSLRYGLPFPNPCVEIIKRYKELGGEIITIGSDAHNPKDISHSFNLINDILIDCGFKYYCNFTKRTPSFSKL